MGGFRGSLTPGSFALALLTIPLALLCAALFVRDVSSQSHHRFAAIDGLRGFLALFVFIHHASIWFGFSHYLAWTPPLSLWLANCGHTSVALFFMITAFLFTTKLLEARERPVDWLRLYVSRVMRLTPLYLCAVAVLFVVVGAETRFQARAPYPDLLAQAVRWLCFTIRGPVDLNVLYGSQFSILGAAWTLPYEWYFYLTLPLVALVLRARDIERAPAWIALAVLTAYSWSSWNLAGELMGWFLAGGTTALIANTPALRDRLSGRGAHTLTLFCLVVAYLSFPPTSRLGSFALLFTAFTFVACGVNVFGLLTWKPARALSVITYGVYLLHGPVLFIAMRFVVGNDRAHGLSMVQHWLVVLACVPVVIFASALAFRFVESPAIRAVPAVTAWFRKNPAAELGAVGDGGGSAHPS